MTTWTRVALGLACLLMGHAVQAQRAPQYQSLDMRVPWTPQPVVVQHHRSLVYELHFTSFAQAPLTLQRLDVIDDQEHVLATFSGDGLARVIGRRDAFEDGKRLTIPAGVDAVAYLTVPWRDDSAPGRRLKHRLVYASSGVPAVVEGGAFTVDAQAPLRLGPPLRGGPWAAIYDASWERGHRRVLYAVNGAVHVPGRFAIDWIRVGKQGGFAEGDGTRPSQWYGYGEDVLAVADALVASTGEGITESPTLAQNAARKVPLQDAAGNYVSLDLGGGRYAFYEHLKPGSVRVAKGDRVTRGQVIAQLGFTGESTGPHLHFHISDHDAPLDAEGLPYALASFHALGAYASIDDFAKGLPWQPTAGGATPERNEMPAPLSVVEFDAPAAR